MEVRHEVAARRVEETGGEIVNIENARKWVAELRSGKYSQCREQMTDGKSFCCLGVAHVCLIGPVPEDAEKPSKWEDSAYTNVDRVLGIGLGHRDVFVHMNDEQGATFDEIADHIENEIQLYGERACT